MKSYKDTNIALSIVSYAIGSLCFILFSYFTNFGPAFFVKTHMELTFFLSLVCFIVVGISIYFAWKSFRSKETPWKSIVLGTIEILTLALFIFITLLIFMFSNGCGSQAC
jgi:hypothetical protein